MQRSHVIRVAAACGIIAILWAILAHTLIPAIAQGPRVQYGETVEGEIVNARESETWTFDGVRGDVITLHVTGYEQLAPRVTLAAPNGSILVQLDAEASGTPDVVFTAGLQESGIHRITITGADNTTGRYALALQLQEPGQTLEIDRALVYGRSIRSTLSDAVFREFWSFRGTRGDIIDVHMIAESGDLDAFVSLISPNGNVIAASNSDVDGRDAALYSVELNSTGTYSVSARRAGANFGETGTTQGDYTLTITLRRPGNPDESPTPAVLAPGQLMRGRLSADAPRALFSVDADGVLALSLLLADRSEIGTISVMTPGRALLHTVSGPSPLRSSVTLPEEGTYWIEVTTSDVREDAPDDFGITVTPLATASRAAWPLLYGHTHVFAAGSRMPEAWYFEGARGDLVELAVEPTGTLLEGRIRVFAPDRSTVIDRLIMSALTQPLLLTSSGPYEIIFEPTMIDTGYSIGITRVGLATLAFAQSPLPRVEMAFPTKPGIPAERSVEPFSTDAWTIDISHPQYWRFTLTATDSNAPLTLAIQAPGGQWLSHAVTEPLTRTAVGEAYFSHPGRYRVLVIDLAGNTATAYRLTGQPTDGGDLAQAIPQKGVLSPDNWYNIWTVGAAPGTLINLHVETPSSQTSLPDVYIIAPDGRAMSTTAGGVADDSAFTLSVPVGMGGEHTVLVRQSPQQERTMYTINAEVVTPFNRAQHSGFAAPLSLLSAPFESYPVPVPQPVNVTLPDLITPVLSIDSPVVQAARRVEMGTIIRGEVTNDLPFQAWQFTANKNQLLEFSVFALEDGEGPDLIVLDANGTVIAEKFTSHTATNYLAQRFDEAGTYTLVVALDGGTRYSLWIDPLNRVDERALNVVPGKAIAYGQTITEQLVSSGDTRSFVFYGRADDAIAARVAGISQTQNLALTLKPVGAGVIQMAAAQETAKPVVIETILPASGLYQLDVSYTDPNMREATPTMFTLHLSISEAAPRLEELGGVLTTARTATLSSATTEHHWLFSAQSGERISVYAAPRIPGSVIPLVLQLADSNGDVFAQRELMSGASSVAFDDMILPRSGVYQVIVTGGQRTPGTYTVSLTRDSADIDDTDNPIRYGETSGKVLSAENTVDVWTFAGSQGDIVAVNVQRRYGDDALLSMQLRSDNGQVLSTTAAGTSNEAARVDGIVLPHTGHYSVVVGNLDTAFQGQTAYDITVLLRGTSARAASTTVAYGQTVSSAFFIDDPSDTWVFKGQQGDIITALVETTRPDAVTTVALLSTDWHAASTTGQRNILTTVQSDDVGTARLEYVLPSDGTYALTVNDVELTGGQYELRLTNENADMTPLLPIRLGQSRETQISQMSLVDTWQFEAGAGTPTTITVLPDSRASLNARITLLDPRGRVLAQAEGESGVPVEIAGYSVPFTGAYSVRVTRLLERDGRTGGRYTITIQQDSGAAVAAPPVLEYGVLQRGLFDGAEPSTQWTMRGERGETVRVRLERTSGTLDAVLRLRDSSGELLSETSETQNERIELLATLPGDGVYTLEAGRYHGVWGNTSGNYTLLAERVYRSSDTPIDPLLGYGDRVTGTTDNNARTDTWPFLGQAGDVIAAQITFPIDDAPLMLSLYDPAGNILKRGQRITDRVLIDAFELPANSVYLLEVRRPGDATARFSPYVLALELIATAEPTPTPAGAMLQMNSTATGQFRSSNDTHTWLFEGTANAQVAFSLLPVQSLLRLEFALRAPDGTLIFSETLDQNATLFTTGTVTLPANGLYVVLVRAKRVLPGAAYRLKLQYVHDEGGIETIMSGEDRFGTISNVQAVHQWRFTAQADTPISAYVLRTDGDLQPTIMIWGPDRQPAAKGISTAYGQVAVQNYVAGKSGEYTVVISREGGTSGHTTGTYRLMLRDQAISPHAASAQHLMFDVPFEAYQIGPRPQYYAFRAERGDVVAVSARAHAGGTAPALNIESEAGRMMDAPVMVAGSEAYIPALWAPYTGYYVIEMAGKNTASYTLAVHKRSPVPSQDSVTREIARRQLLAEGIVDSGAPTYWHFSGAQGEVLTFTVDTVGSNLRADVVLFGPRGFVANVTEKDEPQVVLGPVRLPDNGDYTLVVGAWMGAVGGTTGRYTLLVETAPQGVSGSAGGMIASVEQPVTGGLIVEDPHDEWSFSGRAGQAITVQALHNSANSTLSLKLQHPDGVIIGTSLLATTYQGAEIRDVTLPIDGSYLIQVDGQFVDDEPVDYRLVLLATDHTAVPSTEFTQGIDFGSTRTGEISAGQTQMWVFYATAGDTIQCVVSSGDNVFAPSLALLDPTGATLRSTHTGAGGEPVALHDVALPSSGFHVLAVSNATVDRAEYAISLQRTSAGAVDMGTLTGVGSGTLSATTPVHRWALAIPQSGHYGVIVEPSVRDSVPGLAIMSGSASIVQAGAATGRGQVIGTAYLDADERYTVLVSTGANMRSTHYTVTVLPAAALTFEGSLETGMPDVGRITGDVLNNEWVWQGDAGDTVAITVNPFSGDLQPLVSILDSNASLLKEVRADASEPITTRFKVLLDGRYYIVVSRAALSGGTTEGDYTIRIDSDIEQ